MSDSLPQRPDLRQLRSRAKELRDAARRGDAAAVARMTRHHPGAAGNALPLAAAQLVIARELGFASWPRLVTVIEAGAAARRVAADFVSASVEGLMRRASEIGQADPGIAASSLLAATVLGDATAVREHLAASPAAAVAIDDERGWPPLLYACYSRWHQVDPDAEAGLAEVVRLLLANGASADTNDGGQPRFRSALKGSVEVNNPAITAVLLDAGANPDLGQPIAEAAAHPDRQCLRLLLSHGARVAGTWAVGSAVFHDDPDATTLLLQALAGSGRRAADTATEELLNAAGSASFPVIETLLNAGADPRASDGDGVSALRLAVRAGKAETAARLRALGAADDATDVDLFLGACLNGDRQAAERLLSEHADLPGRLTDEDQAAICDAAESRPASALALMLELGFSPNARKFGEYPLHSAAYHGNAAGVRLLLAAGAEVDARDARFDATPLAFVTVGSGEQAGQPGDWAGAVRLLIEAGASRADVWVTDKPPSEEVAGLLLRYGITAGEPAGQERAPEDEDEAPDTLGTGVMAEIAEHLQVACRDSDLDLLGSLLHPEVRWTGLCHDRAEVLDWYRMLVAAGTTATVRSVQVSRDAVVLGLAVTRQAEGTRPAPPQRLYQVFTVDDDQIVEIRGYGDLKTALAHAGGPAAAS